jgi:hypothetical protein
VIALTTVPTDTWSSLLKGWAKSEAMYSSRKAAETRRLVTRKQYCGWI